MQQKATLNTHNPKERDHLRHIATYKAT